MSFCGVKRGWSARATNAAEGEKIVKQSGRRLRHDRGRRIEEAAEKRFFCTLR